MIIFNPGEKYELRFSSHPRWNELAGSVEILSVERLSDSEMEFKPSAIRGNFTAFVGTIKYIVHSDTTNTKPKSAQLFREHVSKEYATQYCGGVTEYEWFSPTKRNYYPISSEKGRL